VSPVFFRYSSAMFELVIVSLFVKMLETSETLDSKLDSVIVETKFLLESVAVNLLAVKSEMTASAKVDKPVTPRVEPKVVAPVVFKVLLIVVAPFRVDVPATATVPVKLAEEEIVCPLIKPVVNVPVVVRFSFPNEIAPLESVILPSARVKFPTVEPVARVANPVTPNVPPIVVFPVRVDVPETDRFECKVVAPVTPSVESKVTAPVASRVPSKYPFPETESFVKGEVVPIPTFPPSATKIPLLSLS